MWGAFNTLSLIFKHQCYLVESSNIYRWYKTELKCGKVKRLKRFIDYIVLYFDVLYLIVTQPLIDSNSSLTWKIYLFSTRLDF